MMRLARMTIAALGKRIDSRFRRAERRTAARFAAVDKRFDAVDKRFEAVDKRFDAVDKRFDTMGAAIDARFGQVDRNIESIGEKLDWIVRTLRDNYKHQQKALDEHENRLKDLERAARA